MSTEPITVDLSATPASPTQEQIDAAMVLVSEAVGATWTARRLGAQFAFTTPEGRVQVSRRRDFRDAVEDIVHIVVIKTLPGEVPTGVTS